jgi:hypothetical protein
MKFSLRIAKSSLYRVRLIAKISVFAALQKPSWVSSMIYLTRELAEGFAVISPRFLPGITPDR